MRRSWLALCLAAAAALGGVVALAPTLTRAHWIAGLVLRETSLTLTLLAALAWGLTRRAAPGDGSARLARALAIPAGIVGLLPFVTQLAVFPGRTRFSPAEYVLGTLGRPRVEVRHDVVVHGALKADVYHAPGPGPHPFVVTVHGGSWRSGDKGEVPHLARELAAAGYTVFDVQYRMAPSDPFPAAVTDVKCLLGRLRQRAAEFRLHPSRVALLGRSAGGQIALMAAYSAGDPRIPPSCAVPDEPVKAVAALYAPVDLVWGHDNPMRPDVVKGTEALQVYLGGTPRAAAEAYRLASPLSWVDHPLPPTLLLHGGADQIVGAEHSRRLEAALRGRGRNVRYIRVPFGEHGMEARPGSVTAQLTRYAVLDLLGWTLSVTEQ